MATDDTGLFVGSDGGDYRIGQNSDEQLSCIFSHPLCEPNRISLHLPPSGVTWSYALNTNVIDTYGGQVVQILGVSVKNLVIKGYFGGVDPQWGINVEQKEYRPGTPKFSDISRWSDTDPYKWIEDKSVTNGIRQMADWFNYYFQIATQGVANTKTFSNYEEQPMEFRFPARGWKIPIRPTGFPQVRVANDELAPEWVVEADMVEGFETSREFLDDIATIARDRLNELKVGIGFQKRNPFSEYVPDRLSSEELATGIVESYQDSVIQGLSEDEISELVTLGFTYPPGVYKRAGFEAPSNGS